MGKVKREPNPAQVYLEQIEKLNSIIPNKLVERQQWLDLALSITAHMDGERVSSSGTRSKLEEAMNSCMDAAAEIAAAVEKLRREKQERIETIERLDNPTEYRLLHDRYVKYIELKTIAEQWGKDYSTITTTHGRALRHVQDIMDRRKQM